MQDSNIAWLVAGITVILTLVQSARLAWLRRRPSRRSRRRLKKALRGERDAERLLEARGFAIEARQVTAELTLRVDGEPVTAGVRADLIVRRGDARYVAEVKTGKVAPRIQHAPTRRQLLEYALVFDVDGVLLVEPEAAVVREVEFPKVTRFAAPTPRSRWRLVAWIAAALVAAAAAYHAFIA